MTREDAEKIDRVLIAARRLSNVAYHVSNNMRAGDVVQKHIVDSARSAVQDFDFEMKEARDAIDAMRALPAAYDPIEMGA